MYTVQTYINGRDNDPVSQDIESTYGAMLLVRQGNKAGLDVDLVDNLWRTSTRYSSKETMRAINAGEHDHMMGLCEAHDMQEDDLEECATH